MFNPYKILELDKSCSNSDIEHKFRELAIKYHPDKNHIEKSKEMFELISKAKEILIDDNKRKKYDKYHIVDDNDEIKFQEAKLIIQLVVTVTELLKGVNKIINVNREIINEKIIKKELIKVDININIETPINKPIEIEGKGKIIDEIIGNLYIFIKISSDKNYKFEPQTFNIIIKQKIGLIQSLCGFEMNIPLGKEALLIQHSNIIKPTNTYIVKGKGLTIIDDQGQLHKTDVEIIFDVQYNDLTDDTIKKLKDCFNYNYIKKPSNQIINLEEVNNDEIPPLQLPFINANQSPIGCQTQ